MSLLSKIHKGLASLFGESESAVKSSVVGIVKDVAAEHVADAAQALQYFLAEKGVSVDSAILAEGVKLLLTEGEALLDKAVGVE